MAQVHALDVHPSSDHPPSAQRMAATIVADLAPAPARPVESRWRMLAYFAGAGLALGAGLAVLGWIADPAGVRCGLAPVWGPAYMTYPITVALG